MQPLVIRGGRLIATTTGDGGSRGLVGPAIREAIVQGLRDKRRLVTILKAGVEQPSGTRNIPGREFGVTNALAREGLGSAS